MASGLGLGRCGFRPAALVAAVVLAVAGCSPAINLVPETGQNARIGTTSDINPRDPATLQDGGNLRLALTDFPPNFNILHIDGNSDRKSIRLNSSHVFSSRMPSSA